MKMRNYFSGYNSPINLTKGNLTQRNFTDIFKQSKSSANILTNNFNNHICTINRQLSNIKLCNKQVLNISKTKNNTEYSDYINFKNESIKIIPFKLSQYSFSIISKQNKIESEETRALKENVKFLLNQIKKLQKNNNNIDIITKLTEENKILRKKVKEYEEREKIYILENRELKSQIKLNEGGGNSELMHDLLLSSRDMNKPNNTNHNNSIITFANSNSNTTNIFTTSSNNINAKPTEYNIKFKTLDTKQQKSSLYKKKPLSPTKTQTSINFPFNPSINNANVDLPDVSTSPLYLHRLNAKKHNVITLDITSLKYSSTPYIDTSSFSLAYNDTQIANILFLNISNGFIVILGKQCNLVFFYNANSHLISQLQNLNHPHNKGGLIAYKKNSIICLSGMTTTNCEVYNIKNNKWKDIAKMNRPHADAAYAIVNESVIYAIFGFDYEMNRYISHIEKINVETETKWTIIKIANNINKTFFSLKSHSAFVIKGKSIRGLNNERIFIIGGITNENADNCGLMEVRITNDEYANIITSTPNNTNNIRSYTFSSSFYRHIDNKTRKEFLFNIDTDFNLHMIDNDSISHKIYIKPNGI